MRLDCYLWEKREPVQLRATSTRSNSISTRVQIAKCIRTRNDKKYLETRNFKFASLPSFFYSSLFAWIIRRERVKSLETAAFFNRKKISFNFQNMCRFVYSEKNYIYAHTAPFDNKVVFNKNPQKNSKIYAFGEIFS